MKWFREPLLHFLAIGASFFALYAYLNPEAFQSSKTIQVESGQIRSLALTFEKTWNRPPSDEELARIVDDFIIEEVLYRQALALGLDQDDKLIRRRLRQKMEFSLDDISENLEASDQVLEAYLYAHSEKYQMPNIYSFEQIYFHRDRSGKRLQEKIAEAQTLLAAGKSYKGDQTLLPDQLTGKKDFEVARHFGKQFVKTLDTLPLNVWQGPVESGLGVHFVKLTEKSVGSLPAVSQVRQQLLRDWQYDRSQELKKQMLDNLLAEYSIDIDWPEKKI